MLTKWTRHTKDEQLRKDIIASLQAARPALKRMIEILEEDIRTVETKQRMPDAFASPAWPYMQADCNGEIRAYKKIIRLITLDQGEEK